MLNRKIVIGNFKMNPVSLKETENIVSGINKSISNIKKTDIVLCPPVLFLSNLKNKKLKISKKISLGAQNIFFGDTGAFTGEVSAKMLANLGINYSILGHSERREMGESNDLINKKVKSALSSRITPILCVGEKDRDVDHEYLNFIKAQVEECLLGISKNSLAKIVIAYEPVWAIGSNATREATPEEFREIRIFIKKILSDKFGAKAVEALRIIYGGSVHPENTLSFLKEGHSDGFLVGRDSLNPKKFLNIINITESNS